jgi:integrase/recombinase XerD
MAYGCGLRAGELVAVKIEDIDAGLALLRVRGKGGKERLVPFGGRVQDALDRYLAALREIGPGGPYLFPGRGGRGHASRQMLWLAVKRHAARAGVRGVKPHLFRHTFATHLIQAGADVRTVQELLGHANVATTQVYTHLATATLTEFHKKYHPRK